MMWNCYVGSTSSHRALVSSPSLEGSTPFNKYKERLLSVAFKGSAMAAATAFFV